MNNLTVFLKYSFKFELKYFMVNVDNDSHLIVDTSAIIYIFGLTDTQLWEMWSSSGFRFKTNKGDISPEEFWK